MSKFYRTEEFFKVSQEWQKKLKESGFEDIETYTNKLGQIRSTPYVNSDVKNLYKYSYDMSDEFFREYCQLTYLYFAACRAFLAYNGCALPFLDAKILELHAEGYSLRRIARELRPFISRYPIIKRKDKIIDFFGMFYVRSRLLKLKEDVTVWNLTNENGVRLNDYEDDLNE
jgi:hypothetical protein